jgi:catechol 2,3-dioxygenase-like lactoylglutathione lyase family enzyme
MSLSMIGQIALPVSDADVAHDFYANRLGLPLLYRFGSLLFFDCHGVRLMLEGHPDRPGGIPHAGCIYFRVGDIVARRAELVERGVEFVDDPHLIARMPDHELWMSFFRDPDGHLLALMEEKR